MNPAEPVIKTVVLTRPRGSNDALAEQLAVQGVQCIELPMLDIIELTDANDIDYAQVQLQAVVTNRPSYVLFVSANAVNAAARFMRQNRISWPQDLLCMGMGTGTEAAIEAKGWQLFPIIKSVGGDSLTSEQMLAQPWAQDVQGSRIAIVKGQSGRATMADALVARGAQVDSIALYRRQAPEYSDLALHERLKQVIQQPHSSAIVAASGETLQYIDAALQRSNKLSVLKASVRCIVPSQRLVEQASNLGFESIGLADGAGDAAFLRCITACQ